jgi:hypothetical protein
MTGKLRRPSGAEAQALQDQTELILALLDAIPGAVAVIDSRGIIELANHAWIRGAVGAAPLASGLEVGGNLVEAWSAADPTGTDKARRLAAEIRSILDGQATSFRISYANPSATPRRGFLAQASRFQGPDQIRVVLTIVEQEPSAEVLHPLVEPEVLADPTLPPPPPRPLGVLVVAEPGGVERAVLGRLLLQRGHEVAFARDAFEAQDALAESRVDVVVIDPGILEELPPGVLRGPGGLAGSGRRILALGGRTDLLEGFDAILPAPIRPVDLFREVESPEAAPWFDRAVILESLGGSEPLLAEVIATFRVDSLRMADELIVSVQTGDLEATARLAHSLRGMLSQFGPSPALHLAVALDRLARCGEIARFEPLARPIRAAIDLLALELSRL